MSQTIFPAKYYPIYKVYQVIGGWTVNYLSDRHTTRSVDGDKLYSTRQAAYRRCKQLNDSLPKDLATILNAEDVAVYEWGNYTVAVGNRSYEGEEGYNVTVATEDLPPHSNRDFDTLDDVESYLDGTLGYTRGARVWKVVEREDDLD